MKVRLLFAESILPYKQKVQCVNETGKLDFRDVYLLWHWRVVLRISGQRVSGMVRDKEYAFIGYLWCIYEV